MKIKLLVLDLDGTLTAGNHKLSPANINAVNQALAKGIKVIIASGRGPSRIIKIYKTLNLPDYNYPIVCFNGALVYDVAKQQNLTQLFFSKEVAKDIFSLAIKHKISIWGYDADNNHAYYAGKFNLTRYFLLKFYRLKNIKFDPKKFDADVYKLSFLGKDKELDPFFAMINQKYDISVFKSRAIITRARVADIAKKECDKYYAIRAIAKKYNIKDDEIMAIGDGENDQRMIKNAGIGIAVGNAVKSLKEIANDVTKKASKDGVAFALDKHILKEKNK